MHMIRYHQMHLYIYVYNHLHAQANAHLICTHTTTYTHRQTCTYVPSNPTRCPCPTSSTSDSGSFVARSSVNRALPHWLLLALRLRSKGSPAAPSTAASASRSGSPGMFELICYYLASKAASQRPHTSTGIII